MLCSGSHLYNVLLIIMNMWPLNALRWVDPIESKCSEFHNFFSVATLNHLKTENKNKSSGSRATFWNMEFWKKKVFKFYIKKTKIMLKFLWFFPISTNNHRILKHQTMDTRIYTFILKIVSEFYYIAFWVNISSFGEE